MSNNSETTQSNAGKPSLAELTLAELIRADAQLLREKQAAERELRKLQRSQQTN